MKWDFLRPLISPNASEIISDAHRERKCAQVESKEPLLVWCKLVNCRLRRVAGKCALRCLRRYHYELLLSGKLQNGRKIHPKSFRIGLRAFFFKKQAPESQIMMFGFAARGAGQETNGVAQSALSKEGECPFLVEENRH